VVKPLVGLSDAATDVFRGIQGSTKPSATRGGGGGGGGGGSSSGNGGGAASNLGGGGDGSSSGDGVGSFSQVRPARAFYGPERALRCYATEDALAVVLLRSVCAAKDKEGSNGGQGGGAWEGEEEYNDHLDLGRFVLLLSTRRLAIVDDTGGLHLHVWLRSVACCEVRPDGLALHLFDPVVVTARHHGQPQRQGEGVLRSGARRETLEHFIKCASAATRQEIDDRIQQALRALS